MMNSWSTMRYNLLYNSYIIAPPYCFLPTTMTPLKRNHHNNLTSSHLPNHTGAPCGMPLGISPGGQYSQLGPSLVFTMPAGQSWHWPSLGTGHRSATTVPQRLHSVQAKESDTWGQGQRQGGPSCVDGH